MLMIMETCILCLMLAWEQTPVLKAVDAGHSAVDLVRRTRTNSSCQQRFVIRFLTSESVASVEM